MTPSKIKTTAGQQVAATKKRKAPASESGRYKGKESGCGFVQLGDGVEGLVGVGGGDGGGVLTASADALDPGLEAVEIDVYHRSGEKGKHLAED